MSVSFLGSLDPYSRAPRSPKSKAQRDRPQGLEGLSQSLTQAVEDCKSPTTDQVLPWEPKSNPVDIVNHDDYRIRICNANESYIGDRALKKIFNVMHMKGKGIRLKS